MMNTTVFHMILAYTVIIVSEVISEFTVYPQELPLNNETKVLQNNDYFNEKSRTLEHLTKQINLPKSMTVLKTLLNLATNSSKESKRFQDLFFQEFNELLKSNSNYHQTVNEIWKILQDFLLMDDNKPEGEDELKKPVAYETETTCEQQPPVDHEVNRRSNAIHRNPRQLLDKAKPFEGASKSEEESFEEYFLNVTALAERHGYRAREYTVQTNDGYILGLHRIWKTSQSRKGVPVLLMHGLLLDSACWLGAGPEFGLAYLLAQAGYDVWLGNARGNYYSRTHFFLDPRSSSYWQFSADEIGKYDLPATIDKILIETGVEKLNYVGFSQGGGTYFIMCSELPHYCKKANIMIAIAPSGRHLLTKSPVFRYFSEFYERNEKTLLEAGIYEVLPKNGIVQSFFNNFCRISDITIRLCKRVIDLVDSPHPGSFTKESILSMVTGFPAGTSVHNMARYGQIHRSRNIHKFDYGPQKNLQLYGSSVPPIYNLSAVTVPVVVIYGRNDGIVDIDDVKWLIRKLPNVIKAFEVEDPLWTHTDVQYSQYVPKLLYPKVLEYLIKFNKY